MRIFICEATGNLFLLKVQAASINGYYCAAFSTRTCNWIMHVIIIGRARRLLAEFTELSENHKRSVEKQITL